MNTVLTTSPDRATDVRPLGNENVLSLSRRELFWRARFLRESDSLAHLPLLFWLVCDLRPNTAVTLGMQTGVLHFGMCQAIDKSGQDGMCYGFGTWGDDRRVPADLTAYNDAEYEDTSQLYCADAGAAAARFTDGSVDLLVFEQPVSEAQLDVLFSVWMPKMSARGVVVLSGGMAMPGFVAGVLQERGAGLPHVGFEFGGGMDIVPVGAEWPDRLGALVDLAPDVAVMRSMTRVLARIGTLHVNEWRVSHHAERTGTLAAQPDAGGVPGAASSAGPVSAQAEQYAALAAENAALRKQLAQRAQAPEGADAEPVSFDSSTLDVLTRKLEAAHEEVLALRGAQKKTDKQMEAHEEYRDKLRLELRQHALQVKKLNSEQEAHEAYRDKLRRDLREQALQIKNLTKLNAELEEDRALIRQSLDHLRESSSWRLTEPLRRLRTRLGKGNEG